MFVAERVVVASTQLGSFFGTSSIGGSNKIPTISDTPNKYIQFTQIKCFARHLFSERN